MSCSDYGTNNIDSDPLFTDPENQDFSLQSNSPCIDAGTADIDGDGVEDITDYVGIAPDMGSYEYGSTMSGDLNGDGVNNVLDIVGLVNIILTGPPSVQLPTWDYVDINSNSDYFNQLIGPDTFNGNVSLYYFGKAG